MNVFVKKILKFCRVYKWEIILFFGSLMIQFSAFFILSFSGENTFIQADTADYFSIGYNWLYNNEFSVYGLGPDAFRTPLYPIFLAILYYIVMPEIWFIILIHNLIAAFTIVIIYKISKILFGRLAIGYNLNVLSAAAAGMFMLEAERIQMANSLMSESLFLFFFFFGIFYFFKWMFIEAKNKNAIFAGSLLGLSALTRPIAQLVPIILIFFAAGYISINKNNFNKDCIKRHIKGAVLLGLFFILVIAPWSIRNKYHFGSFKLSPLFGYNFYRLRVQEWKFENLNKAGNINARAIIDADEQRLAKEIRGIYYQDMPSAIRPTLVIGTLWGEKYALRESWREIKKDPAGFLIFNARLAVRFFIDSASPWFLERMITQFAPIPHNFFFPYFFIAGRLWWASLYLVIGASLIIFRKKNKDEIAFYALFTAIIAYFVLISAAGQMTRFRLPALPFIFILFVHSMFCFLKKTRLFGSQSTNKT